MPRGSERREREREGVDAHILRKRAKKKRKRREGRGKDDLLLRYAFEWHSIPRNRGQRQMAEQWTNTEWTKCRVNFHAYFSFFSMLFQNAVALL